MQIDGLWMATHYDVYRPDEDTLLLAGAVRAALRPGEHFLEVGCGAGYVALVAARLGCAVTATDMNPHAVDLTLHNAHANGLRVQAVETDLLAGLPGPFDVVAFNPPYLPTAPDEVMQGPLNLAFDGGPDGNATVLRFARQLGALRPLPRLVLVVHSTLSDPRQLDSVMEGLGYTCSITAERDLTFERLTVRNYAMKPAGPRPAAPRPC